MIEEPRVWRRLLRLGIYCHHRQSWEAQMDNLGQMLKKAGELQAKMAELQ